MIVIVNLTQNFSLLSWLLRPRFGRLRCGTTVLLTLGWRVWVSCRWTGCMLRSHIRLTTLSGTWPLRHACRAKRLVIHVTLHRPLLLSLSDVDGLHLRPPLRRLSSVRLHVRRRYGLRDYLSRPVLRVMFLYRTTVR